MAGRGENLDYQDVAKKDVSLSQGRAMSEQAMRALYELRENCQLCDAVVRLDDGTTYNVHRAILSACSLYFR